ncbi:MAG: AAA family ATPase [Solirubrobacterales bacterium]|nr:AAA family ATPase [Solirubrobacterales bacterium]
MGAGLELGVLGPIEVRIDHGEPVALGGVRQRALLAILGLHANEVVSTDRLVDDLWGEHPPATAVHTVQVFVSRLRRALAPAGERLVTRPPGYALEVGPDELDASRCERLYGSARAALTASNAAEAAALLRDAQALWRGPPLVDFTYEPFAQATIARLEELRLSCREELIEAQLALGRHDEVVSELEALVREHPFRERPRGQLMLALYRCGRQAQALEAFQQARRALIEELAVEPGQALRELEQAILRQDASLQLQPSRSGRQETPEAPDRGQPSIAASVGAKTPSATVRKTVTVLVAKFSGEGEADPETTRTAIGIARERADAIVGGYGGGFVAGLGGDLAWVFGLPLVREDDALRALRAANEVRAAVVAGAPQEPRRLNVRIGIATGEIIAQSASDLFGAPLSRGIALAQAASADEILVGDATRRLVFGAIRVEPAVDGTAWRVLSFEDQRPIPVRIDSPMVGREEELEQALAACTRVRKTGKANLFTVVGEAGIGKSRLAQELGARLGEEVTIVGGRCLSYGQGIAYWPLREALTHAAGEESRDGIRRLLNGTDDADVVADIVAAALGLAPAESVGEQLPWAFRRLLEAMAGRRPLLFVIDDVHWADAPLLDLVEYLVDWCKAPVLLVCLGRPELLEVRPTWGGGQAQVSSVVLGPLDEAAAFRLLENQLGQRQLSDSQRAQILRTAEGNPLFVEQLLQMSAEDPAWEDDGQIPGTIQALLSARLDRLGPGERAFIECAALIGREFWPSAVCELLPAEARSSAGKHLHSLVHRGLMHPDRSILAGEEQLRFHHILIRDVAYRSTPKATRSELHERFADWLVRRGDGYDEFVGYHLEQAFRYRVELAPPDDVAQTLAGRAGDHLAVAGRRALSRGDAHAAVRLLRSAENMLEMAGRRQPGVLLDLGGALADCGDLHQADVMFTAALDQSRMLGEDNLAARASIELSFNHVLVDPSIPLSEMLHVAEDAVRTFERGGDHGGIARAWHHVAMVHWIQSRAAKMEEVLERAMRHAERAGDWQMQSRILGYLARAIMTGPRPVAEGIERCGAILARAGDDVVLTATTETMLGMLEAMRGNFSPARLYAAGARRRLEAVGLTVTVAVLQMYSGWIELMAQSPERALAGLRDAYDLLDRIGEGHRRAMTAAVLGRLLFFDGDYDESDRYLKISEECASPDDVAAQTVWRGTRARLLTVAAELRDAKELAKSAVAAVTDTDYLRLQGDALGDRATVLVALGQNDAALDDLNEARARFERKGITSSLETLLRSFESLAAAR